ncbi:MAG: NAD(P)H-hydrate dehydratase [Geminicoccaceae bacterium]
MAGDGILLPPDAMAAVDRAAIAGGCPGPWLMENAGRAVVTAMATRFTRQPVLVLCGPGNNGGDGWVIARRLHRAGWPVRVASLVDREALRGDAAEAAKAWDGPVGPLSLAEVNGASLVVDALFGAGLARDLDGIAKGVVEALPGTGCTVVAVDVPSGVDGATGAVRGAAAQADLTVTFCRLKPGHLLLPGRSLCGPTVLADIGIPDAVARSEDVGLRRNEPALWRSAMRPRTAASHKYDFGHAMVVGGLAATTGAARLAAGAALRVGAGLVSIACPKDSAAAYAQHVTAVMTKPFADAAALEAMLQDRRFNALLIGPGTGVGEGTRQLVEILLRTGRPLVLDADALTTFAASRSDLFARLHGGCLLTPHDGEFARLFDVRGDRLTRARAAAREARCTVLLKGGDTVVASPDGRAAIMADAPPDLATAGTGDVLAGLVLGLLAQGLPAYEAAAAGVWLHGAVARVVGRGLIAEDLAVALPRVLKGMNP